MSRLFTVVVFLFCVVVAGAQRNYTEAMQQGDDAFSSRQFKTAINKYFAAEAFDPSKKSVVKEKVNRVFDNVELLRKEAEAAKTQAVTEKEKAEKAKQEQALQTNIAVEEKRKMQVLNNFMRYNNEQLFEEIRRNKADLLDLKIKEYNLLNKYNDSSNDDTYRFFSLYAVSEYYERNKSLEDAFIWADALCRQYPDSAISYMRRSIVNYYLGNWQKALDDTDTCLALNHYDFLVPILKWNKALAYCNMGKHPESRKWLSEAIPLLRSMTQDETWSDDFVAADIIKTTSIYSIFMGRDYQVKTLEVYGIINDVYEGIVPAVTLENLGKPVLPLNVLLSILNYTSIHLQAQPNEYIGYLVKGYFWEMANYPEPAKTNYRLFLQQHKKIANPKYNKYKSNFSSNIYNTLKN